ncbi:hypothetical protein GWI33_008973 [Rhynchophorus ferrugineus]|uniref:Uncharacterized protein n=1 Tax=Rhynchophorus ferrugineus TaxID=354439 RepID=A0A834IC60_RHYFE|nr:hypothetical protein GWI33_008973 [Rhynchophorus ferrugineus]
MISSAIVPVQFVNYRKPAHVPTRPYFNAFAGHHVISLRTMAKRSQNQFHVARCNFVSDKIKYATPPGFIFCWHRGDDREGETKRNDKVNGS